MRIPFKLTKIFFIQLFHNINFWQRYGIKVNAFITLEHISDLLNIRQFLTISTFSQICATRKEIWFISA